MYLRRRRAHRRAELETREAWRDRLFGILDRATVEHLYESPEFAELRTFLANTFHEDWSYDAPAEEGAVQLYLDLATADDVAALRLAIDRLLALGLTDEQMDEGLSLLGCNYKPDDWPTVPWEANAWVRSTGEMLA
jgi:hypothetical protein